jgi:hypothetical protein
MLRILQDSKEKHFEGIATDGELWFQYSRPPSQMFAQSPRDAIPRTQQAIEMKETMITIFFTGRKRIVLDISPKESKFNQLYFADHISLNLKRENMNFHRRILLATFWVHMDNSMCHNGSKVASEFAKIMFHDYHAHPIRQT